MTGLARRSTNPDGVGGPAGLRLALIAVLAGVFLWGGCSVEKNYALLSFFLDGVPEPGVGPPTATADRAGPLGVDVLTVISAHSAFTEERCRECHGESAAFGLLATGFTGLDDESCLVCHDPAEDEETHTYMHGPVATRECLWCHEAHESTNPYLMVQASPDLCLGCHGFEVRGPGQPPEHEDLQRDCLDCHLGHGGEDRYLLKPRETWEPEDGQPESSEASIEPKKEGQTDLY